MKFLVNFLRILKLIFKLNKLHFFKKNKLRICKKMIHVYKKIIWIYQNLKMLNLFVLNLMGKIFIFLKKNIKFFNYFFVIKYIIF